MSYIPFDKIQIMGEVDIKEEPYQFDAYGRLRTSSATTIFKSQLVNSVQDKFWHTITMGGGTTEYLSDQGSLNLNVTDVNDKVIRQTKWYIPVSMGMVYISGNISPDEGITKRLGYFDNDNGIFFETDGSTLSIVIRSKVSGEIIESKVPQTSWNIDKMDGTGKSGINLNITNNQVFIINNEWMGIGKVRVGFLINGLINYVHEFKFSNFDNRPYIQINLLPIRFEIENVSNNSSDIHSLKQIAVSVIAEEKEQDIYDLFTIGNEITPRLVTFNLTPILSIRPKLQFNNKINRIITKLNDLIILNERGLIYFEVRIGTTLENACFNDVNPESNIEYDISANSYENGKIIFRGYARGGVPIKVNFDTNIVNHILSVNYDGSDSTVLTVLAKKLMPFMSTDVSASISWLENN